MVSKVVKPTFEESLPIIDEELKKRKNRWMLNSVSHIGYDDVCQIIRFHLHVKWHLYDPSKPIRNWISTVISHQTRNIIRNVYSNNAPICHKCPCNQGGGLCSIFGYTQVMECRVYKEWADRKQNAFHVKLPLSLEHHIDEVHNIVEENIDIEATSEILHRHMKIVLDKDEWVIYDLLFIKGKTEDEVAKMLGYRSNEKFRPQGYRTIAYFRNSIMKKVKEAIYGDNGIDIVK